MHVVDIHQHLLKRSVLLVRKGIDTGDVLLIEFHQLQITKIVIAQHKVDICVNVLADILFVTSRNCTD